MPVDIVDRLHLTIYPERWPQWEFIKIEMVIYPVHQDEFGMRPILTTIVEKETVNVSCGLLTVWCLFPTITIEHLLRSFKKVQNEESYIRSDRMQISAGNACAFSKSVAFS